MNRSKLRRPTAVSLFLLILLTVWLGANGRPALAREWVGEAYSLSLTNSQATEIVQWVLAENPHLPFRDPLIEIRPDEVYGQGCVPILQFCLPISGTATLYIEDGRPNGRLTSLNVAGAEAPAFVLKGIGDARALYDATALTIIATNLELRDGELLLEGVYR